MDAYSLHHSYSPQPNDRFSLWLFCLFHSVARISQEARQSDAYIQDSLLKFLEARIQETKHPKLLLTKPQNFFETRQGDAAAKRNY